MIELEIQQETIARLQANDPVAYKFLLDAAEEAEKLKQPPPLESWKKLVELAYTQGGNGPDLIHAITSHYNAMRAALEKITRTPVMPFPDRVAHSERAYANAVYGAWARIQGIARQALQASVRDHES